MISALKTEFRKLLTIRTTYFISLFTVLLTIFFTFYVEGYRGLGNGEANPLKLTELILNITSTVAQIGFIVPLVLMIHEYRYNLITYTFTSINSRTKVLISKIIVAIIYMLGLLAICLGIGLASYRLGLAVADKTLVPQNLDVIYILARSVFYTLGFSLLGLMVATLTRSIIMAMFIMFMVPTTIEPLLGLLLKENTVYLPFALLGQQIGLPANGDAYLINGSLAPGKAALVFSFYLVSGWLITGWLFKRRDAN